MSEITFVLFWANMENFQAAIVGDSDLTDRDVIDWYAKQVDLHDAVKSGLFVVRHPFMKIGD